MTAFPRCPSDLPAELRNVITQLALAWAQSSIRPKVNPAVEQCWTELARNWADNDALPLFIRKVSNFKNDGRGQFITHRSGRQLIPCDNSVAVWSFTLAWRGECPSLEEIIKGISGIPVAFLKLGAFAELYTAGWKLAHIEKVGLNTRQPLETIPIENLKEHFRRLIDPANMFVVPKRWAGIGELPELIEAIKSTRSTERP